MREEQKRALAKVIVWLMAERAAALAHMAIAGVHPMSRLVDEWRVLRGEADRARKAMTPADIEAVTAMLEVMGDA
ncbi:MAG: hypothetical protein IT337_06490 [Thermomicrobiales bacterium]|nr:hypothetical protein [Thermomicrobiales bacterium]